MTSPDALPPLRTEFQNETSWGVLSGQLRRFEIATPEVPGPFLGISRTVGCIHAGRCSLVVRIGGGHLRAPTEELLKRIAAEAPTHLGSVVGGPTACVSNVVSWLEEEQRSGFLERSYTTVTLLVAVSDAEAWALLVSPHGIVHGRPDSAVFESTDLRYPVLRRLGIMKEPTFPFPGTGPGDQASSIFCVGTPAGYERIRTHLGRDEVLIAFERGSLPFGPWPTERLTLGALWGMDAAWKHGLAGRAVVLGHTTIGDLALPDDWEIREVPIVP